MALTCQTSQATVPAGAQPPMAYESSHFDLPVSFPHPSPIQSLSPVVFAPLRSTMWEPRSNQLGARVGLDSTAVGFHLHTVQV